LGYDKKLVLGTKLIRDIQENIALLISDGILQGRRGSNALLPHITVVLMVGICLALMLIAVT
jgi:hypothetical protein